MNKFPNPPCPYSRLPLMTEVTHPLNANFAEFVAVETAAMEWQQSPSPTVWRKRLYLEGEKEAGRVTSVVRYAPNSSFPAHEHPAGEEILVLEGTFSDERDDYPAGSYLLNPEGFRHAPFSQEGCTIFVRLRQYPGGNRQQVAVNFNEMPWLPGPISGVWVKQLYAQSGYPEQVWLEKWDGGMAKGRTFGQITEIFIVDGSFSEANCSYPARTWLRYPAGSRRQFNSEEGCVLYVKQH